MPAEYSEEMYMKCLNAIATYYTIGKEWSEKFENYSGFLNLRCDFVNADAPKKIDELFALRNDIAHLNRHYDCPPTLTTEDGFKFNRETVLDNENYRKTITHLINIMNDAIILLEHSDLEVHNMWPMQTQKPTEQYTNVVQNEEGV
jgi:hypothetical protein